VSNYVHDLISGHIRFFLRKFGNIYRFGNVGFESFVGVVRSFVMRRTQEGGHSGDKKPKKKRTIARAMGQFAHVRLGCTLAALNAGGSSSKRSNAIESMRKNGLNIWKETRGVVRKKGRSAKLQPSLQLVPEDESEGASEIGDFEKDMEVEVEKADKPGKGLGVRIRENVKMGTFIGECYGEVISSGKALRCTGENAKVVEVDS